MKKILGIIFVAALLVGGTSAVFFQTGSKLSADPGTGGMVIINADPGTGGM